MKLNLARRPFRNRRPRRRIMMALWTLAGLAFAWNAFLFVQYWRGSSNGREELRAIRDETSRQVAAIGDLRKELSGADLGAQNEHVRFLNRKIAERTFPWSLLFDDIAEVLPRNVRIDGMAPSIPIKKKKGREKAVAGSTSIDWIQLELGGTAKGSEDLLDLVDAMFDSPAFTGPVLHGERATDGGEVEFDFSVRYRVAKPAEDLESLAGATQLTAGGSGETVSGAEELVESVEAFEGGSDRVSGAPGADVLGSGSRKGVAREVGANPRARVTLSEKGDRAISESQTGLGRDAPPNSGLETRRTASGREETSGRDQASSRSTAGSPSGSPDGGLRASGFRPQGTTATSGTATSSTAARNRAKPDGRTPSQAGQPTRRSTPQRPVERTTEEIADERFGTKDPVAPRLPNASGSGNGGFR